MPAGDHKLQILVIRSWVEDLRPIREVLAAGGLCVELTSVDFEAALNAALSRGGYDLAIYDRETPGLSQEIVDACVRANKRHLPVVALGDLATLAERIGAALATVRN